MELEIEPVLKATIIKKKITSLPPNMEFSKNMLLNKQKFTPGQPK